MSPPCRLRAAALTAGRPLPRSFLHTFIAVGVTIAAFGLFVAETLDIVIGASLAAGIMIATGGRVGKQVRRSAGGGGAPSQRALGRSPLCSRPLPPNHTGCLSVEQARRAIRWEIILVIAASLGVSAGMETSGASAAIANGLVDIGRKAGGEGFIIVGERWAAGRLGGGVGRRQSRARE